MGPPAVSAAVLLIDIEPALAALIGEWLAGAGLAAVDGTAGEVALALVELAYPRRDGARLRALAARLPGTPIVVLSPTFLGGVCAHGALARELGVAAVLPAPVGRDALLAAVA